jgi:uncharacterized protein
MRILCIADHIDPIIYSQSLKDRFKNIDLVLSAGDLPMDYLGFIASNLNKPILFVFGNHNLKKYSFFRYGEVSGAQNQSTWWQKYNRYGSTYIGDKIVRRKSILVAGFGGAMNYNRGENQYSDFQMYLKIIKKIPRLLINRLFFGRYIDVLLTHAPPRDINDRKDPCHRGFKSFRWFIRVFKPKYHIHGHIHLYNLNETRKQIYFETEVINAYNHVVVEL